MAKEIADARKKSSATWLAVRRFGATIAPMKKLFAVIATALVVAAGLWIAFRIQLANQLATVPELLPKSTLLLVEAPDVKRSRDLWHTSDLYQIWREPAVQAWLQKPLDQVPANRAGRTRPASPSARRCPAQVRARQARGCRAP